ncbi:hypothetical protein O9929_24220 [Vibrio lentus]|nr:hypothetical protein [Vibrio lentus]
MSSQFKSGKSTVQSEYFVGTLGADSKQRRWPFLTPDPFSMALSILLVAQVLPN